MDPLKTSGSQPQEARATKKQWQTELSAHQLALKYSSYPVHREPEGIKNTLKESKGRRPGARESLEVSLAQQHLSHEPAGHLSFLQDDSCAA